ncbi:MAG TPA: hypothetical protein VH720_02310 [Candidatus Limnocylindrales bacterium]
MSGPRQPIRPDELDPSGGRVVDALEAGRTVEAWAARESVMPSSDFADRVMAAITAEPEPMAPRAAIDALATGRLRAFVAAVRGSWAIAFGPARPFAVRAPALALILVLALAGTTIGGVAAAGAFNLLSLPAATPEPIAPSPSPSPTPSPTISPTPSESPSPSPSSSPRTPRPSAGQTVEPTPTVEPAETAEPTETPEGGNDHGGGEGSSSSPDGGEPSDGGGGGDGNGHAG